MKCPHHAAALAAAVLLPQSVSTTFAQETVTDAVVVTATRQPQRASDVLSRVEIIDRDAIERAGQSSLVDLLRAQPGIRVSTGGGLGANASVFIRGAESRHTLVLIDGMRMGSATTGQPALEAIPLAMIERIEILRGPASALYGSEAIGGVIQIFTRKGVEGFQPEVFAGYGSNSTFNANASLTGGSGRLRYNLTAGQDETDGFNAKRDPEFWNLPWGNSYHPDRDGFRNRFVSASASVGLRERDEAGVNLYYSDGRNWYDSNDFFNSYLDKTLSAYSAYMTNQLADGWTSTLRAGRTEDKLSNWPDLDSFSRFDSTQTQFVWQNDVRLPVGSLMAAYEYVRSEVDATTDFTVTRRTVNALLLGWSARFDAHNLQVNARHDDNSQFGGKTTGLLSYGYQVSKALALQASIGNAFNAPTFNQLYWPDTGFGGGNPNLQPEEALSREVGLRWDDGTHSVEFTYYNNRVEDMIADWPPANVNRARLEGIEVIYRTRVAGFDLQAGIDLLSAEDEDSGKNLPRRAEQMAFARVDRASGAWNYGVEAKGSGHSYDDAANTVRLGGYGLVDAYAHYRINPEWRVEMRANNVFDRDYEISRGYATDGANVFVGVRYAPR